MFCVNCGKPLALNTKFCGSCGRSIDESQKPKPESPATRRGESASTVSVTERLLASISFTALFTILLLVETWYTDIWYIGTILGGYDPTPIMSDVHALIIRMIPSFVAITLIVWCFMPRIISDYRDCASLKRITNRLVTLNVCIISMNMPLMLIQSLWGEMLDIILPNVYFLGVGFLCLITCLLFVLLMHKIIKASVAGKPTRTLTTLVFTLAIVFSIVASILPGFLWRSFGEDIPYSVIRLLCHVAAGGLTLMLSVAVVAIMRSFKKAS